MSAEIIVICRIPDNYNNDRYSQMVTEGKTEVPGRRGEQLLDDLKEKTGYWKLKEAPDRTVWRTGFGRGCGPVVRQAPE